MKVECNENKNTDGVNLLKKKERTIVGIGNALKGFESNLFKLGNKRMFFH